MRTCDHNSQYHAIVGLVRALMSDIAMIHGINTDREVERLRKMPAVNLFTYLDKHRKVLVMWLQGDRSFPDVRKKDGYPIFLHELWVRLDSDDVIASVFTLYQATSLFKKWRGFTVAASQVAAAGFRERMEQNRAFKPDFDLLRAIRDQLPLIIGFNDLPCDPSWVPSRRGGFRPPRYEKQITMPKITSGARYERTPVLARIDTISSSPCDEYFRELEMTIDHAQGCNRMVEVPKTWDKNRLVFAERSPNMNLQQLLREWLEIRCTESKLGPKYISFDDQTKQHDRLALSGSSSIDLSDASDRLKSSVIYFFLAKYPVLRSALFSARSTKCGDEVIRCYGTMGNATTFTIMTIFLACLARLADLMVAERSVERVATSTVFGDDIITDSRTAGTVLYYLRRVGLVPSLGKTFIDKDFKESCGVDLYREVDVTPVYAKALDVASREDYASVVSLSNAFYRRGLWRTASFVAGLLPTSTVNVDELSLFSFVSVWKVATGDSQMPSYWHRDHQKWLTLPPDRPAKSRRRDSRLDLQYSLARQARIIEQR